jgi:hypothetical protein
MRDFQRARQWQTERPTPRAKMMNFEILRRGPTIFGAKGWREDYGTMDDRLWTWRKSVCFCSTVYRQLSIVPWSSPSSLDIGHSLPL